MTKIIRISGAEDLTSLYLTTEAQNIEVTVYFERAHYELRTSVSGGGTIECDDKTSAPTPTTTVNSTPPYRQRAIISRRIVYAASQLSAGQDNGDGSNTLSHYGHRRHYDSGGLCRDNYS